MMGCSNFMGMMQSPDVPKETSEEILDKINPVEVLDMDSSSFMEMMELLDILEETSEQTLNENNPAEWLSIDSPNFMAMVQGPADPMDWRIQCISNEQ